MNKLITSVDPNGNIAESYRTLRTNLMYRNFVKELKLINVVSTAPSEAKTSTIANLANVHAQLGKNVLLVDLDLRKPSLHHKLGMRNKVGVNDLLNGVASLDEVVQKYDENLSIITSGTKALYNNELIQSAHLAEFLEDMKKKFDLVFVDCPPIRFISDGIILSKLCDGTLLVVEYNAIDKKEVKKSFEQLKAVDANIVGTVMTKVDIDSKKYSYYAYGYSYGKEEELGLKKKKQK
jgi:capsular exopolysaccharide synthesis family protein